MSVKTFAAIDVGSFEMAMKIYELSEKNGLKEIDYVRHRLSLGNDSYNTGKISFSKIDELCNVLLGFKNIMKSYKVNDYKAYGTSALRETANAMIIQDQIKNRTGIKVEILSNSEQRFLDYKSVASKGKEFNDIIKNDTAIVDIGGGNIQISLFENDTLVFTQSLKLGVMRLLGILENMRVSRQRYGEILEEIIDSQLDTFRKIYMKDRDVVNLIVVDDYVSPVLKRGVAGVSKNGYAKTADFSGFVRTLPSKGREQLAEELELSDAGADLMVVSANLIDRVTLMCRAENIWAPGVTISDGIAYEYAEKKGVRITDHDFEKDILATAFNISKRYMGSRKRAETLSEIALQIFDAMKKVHGMGKRERFLLQLSTILHDCGKYINMTNVGECSYNIIMNTEMIGLSHMERQIVAYVVMFNHDNVEYYDELAAKSDVDRESYLKIARLTAILRISGGLDKSHKQKMRKMKAELKDDRLIISSDGQQDILFEKEAFGKKAAFFSEVYNIEPVIVQKR